MFTFRPMILIIVVQIFLAVPAAHAGTGVFSRDGNTVYLANGQLCAVDLTRPNHIDRITTPTEIGEAISAVTRAGDLIVCLSQHHVASFDPKTGEWKKLTDSTGEKFLNLSYDSKNDLLLITKYPGNYAFYDGSPVNLVCMSVKETSPTTVRSRGVGFVRGPAFDAEGRLFFSWLGDLWLGAIEKNATGVWLVGKRVAPLALPETAVSNSYGWGIFEITPAGSRLYFHNKQRGGTTFGSIMSIANPASIVPDETAPYRDEAMLLASARVITDQASATPFLCSSPDGKKVFFVANNKCWLIQNGNQRQLATPFQRMRQ